MVKEKFTNKQKCTNCIHKKICSIYDFAKRNNRECTVKIVPHSMADICCNYRKEWL